MKELEEKLEKMLLYCKMIKLSERKEVCFRDNKFYVHFGTKKEQINDIEKQKKVTARLLNRLNTLKLEL